MKNSEKFNLDYRPETYWLEDESLTYHDELGALIATVTYHSVFGEMIGIYAQKVGDKIKYSARDIYAPQFGTTSNYKVFPNESSEPLSLGQIIELIASGYLEGCNYKDQPGLVFPILNMNHELGEVSRESLDHFVHVKSDFYPDLCRWYADAIARWVTRDGEFSSIDKKLKTGGRIKLTSAPPDSPIFRRGLQIRSLPASKKSTSEPQKNTARAKKAKSQDCQPLKRERIKNQKSTEQPVESSPIPLDAFPASDPDPEVMKQLYKDIMEERHQREKRKKRDQED